MPRSLSIGVIGAGMAGIASVARLLDAGHHDVAVYEKADDVGGTWRENTYPGIACDVPSHLYSYSFEPNPEWSHTFSPGAEIQAYFRDVADRRGVYERTRFGDEVTSLAWRGDRWNLETASGHRAAHDVIIAATGVLHHPNVPQIPGLDSFAGHAFHSARWDHSAPLDSSRVGVVGTGSSAVQITGAIVDRVARFTLFQRTPQWIMPIDNPAYTSEQREAYRNDLSLVQGARTSLGRAFADNFANAVVDADSPEMALIETACRDNLERSVADPDLRDRLRPDYRAACKRLIASADFYQAIQHPNAHLVTESIERIEPAGVRTNDGRLHELDTLVLATGFRADRFLRPIEVVGRDGVRLDDVWRDRPSAYLALVVPQFPNLFLLNGPNGPVGNFSLIDVTEVQLEYVIQLLDSLRADDAVAVEVTASAADQFESDRVAATAKTVWVTGCKSWYLDDRGVPTAWPWTYQRFRDELAVPNASHFRVFAESSR